MATPPLNAPIPTGPLVDQTGNVNYAWRAFLETLWNRTGGNQGQSSNTAGLQTQIIAERSARVAGDNALGAEIITEQSARAAGDNTNATAIASEAMTRAAMDGLMVPIARLCTLWAQCNLTSLLPTSDPGSGQPWNSGGFIALGTTTGMATFMEGEDNISWWIHEDGVLSWLWG